MSFIRRKIGGKAVKARLSGNARAALFSFLAVLMFLGSVPYALAAVGDLDATYNAGAPRPYIAKISTLGVFDDTFPAGTGFNGTVRSIVVQGDGKFIVGGAFTSFNGTTRNRIARLNADGSLDATFDPGTGFDNQVDGLMMDGTDVYAFGTFTSYNGTSRNFIARINTDGSLDTGFDPGTGPNGNIYAVALDGTDVYVAGNFTYFNGVAHNYILRLNTDGSNDAGFDPGTSFNGQVKTLLMDGTDVYAGGMFTTYNGTGRTRIVRINTDGSLDAGFDPGTGFNGTVYSLMLEGTDVYVGGDFSAYNGTSRANIARVNTDGSIDAGFAPVTVNSVVNAMALDGTDVVIGGVFTHVNGSARKGIARLNTNGTLDAGLNVGAGMNDDVNTLVMSGTDVVIGGAFVTDANTGFNGNVLAALPQSDGKVIVGGDFTAFSGTARNRIARLNADGTLDATFDPGTGFSGTVNALALDGTDVYVGGNFTSFNGTGRNYLARLNTDGTLDAGFDPGTGFNGIVYALAMDGTDVYAGGSFTSFNGTSRNYVARINTDGSIDAGFDPGTGFDSTVFALAMDGTDVYAGGNFTSFNGTSQNYITRVNTDGSLDAGFNIGTGLGSYVRSIVVFGTDVYVGGYFTTYKGSSSNRIIRLNTDGSADTDFAVGTGFDSAVLTMTMDGSDVIAGGDFATYQGSTKPYIVRLNSNGTIDTAFSSTTTGFGARVSSVSLSGTDLIAGGSFLSYRGAGIIRLAKVSSTDPAGFTIAQTGGTTSVAETGTTDTFTVVLHEKPASDVVITVVSSDTGEATVAPASLTFTSSNWYTPQTVTVTGVDDALVDGTQTSSITMSISDAASSNEYDPVADQVVSAEVTDNDGGGGGGGGPSTITMTSPNGGESWTAAQQKQITWQYGGSANHTVTISLSTDGGATYAQIAQVGQLDPGLYLWTVPDINTTTARIKVDFVQNAAVAASDASNANFTIVGTVATPPAGGGGGGGNNNVTPPAPAPTTTVFTPSSSINEDLGIVPSLNPINCVSGSLIRTATQNAVYYCGSNGKRYVFPNEKIFLSWYADFSGVTVISAEQMASVMLGGNVTYKPGTRMIKIESDPKVYVVSRGGLLRWVPTEEIATHLYGAAWNKRIDDVSVSFFPNYHFGPQIAPTESL